MPAINASEITLKAIQLLLGTTGITVFNPSTLVHGQKTIAAAGTEEAIAGDQPLVVGVTVKALAANAGNVFVGINGVTAANGFELAPGEQIFIPIDNTQVVFIDVANNGDGISYLGN